MNTDSHHDPSKPATGCSSRIPRNLWPTAIVAYFAVAILFLTWFVVLACQQKTDLVGPDYYEQEVHYQDQLDRLNRTHQSDVSVNYDHASQAITIRLPASHADHSPSGRIQCYRPSDASLDRELPLTVNSKGIQKLETKHWREGLWKVRLHWTVSAEEFFFDQPVFISSGST